MGYNILEKINWTFFTKKIQDSVTGENESFGVTVAASATVTYNYKFKSFSVLNTHASAAITLHGLKADGTTSDWNITIPFGTTVNFDAGGNGNTFRQGHFKLITGSGTAIVIGTKG